MITLQDKLVASWDRRACVETLLDLSTITGRVMEQEPHYDDPRLHALQTAREVVKRRLLHLHALGGPSE